MELKKNEKHVIQREFPPVGTSLIASFKGKHYSALVVEAPQFPRKKGIRYNKIIYRSMTAAANAITHNAVNGWRFWKIR